MFVLLMSGGQRIISVEIVNKIGTLELKFGDMA